MFCEEPTRQLNVSLSSGVMMSYVTVYSVLCSVSSALAVFDVCSSRDSLHAPITDMFMRKTFHPVF